MKSVEEIVERSVEVVEHQAGLWDAKLWFVYVQSSAGERVMLEVCGTREKAAALKADVQGAVRWALQQAEGKATSAED